MMSGGSLEVQETGRALKVHTETPHLVSLGGGRLSTAVTLHPLPEGRTTVGSGKGVDIAVLGTGVEPIHCHIDNQDGVVTLLPQAEMTSIDQVRVTHPVRLSQGCMLCVGRSNMFRFNHPAEARLMKSVLPNPRISMLPVAYYQGDEVGIYGSVEGKPPPAPRRSGGSRDSWGELSSTSSDDLATRLEMSKFISPKVFPPGSTTVNSPASAVLGTRSNTPSKLNLYRITQTNGVTPPMKNQDPVKSGDINEYSYGGKQKEFLQNGNRIPNGNIYQNVSPLPNGQFVPLLDSPNSRDSSRVNSASSPSPTERGPSPLSGRPNPLRSISTPSPAFDRNPSYFSTRKSVTSPTASWDSSIEDLTSKKGEMDFKRKQIENERMQEQENERIERLRLDEILTMCADYEKQAQWERLNKPQQNRIITNGSLPRDKRLNSPHSPQINQSFSFDTDMPPTIHESPHPDQNSKNQCMDHMKAPNYENVSLVHPSSPRTRIKTSLPNKDCSSRDNSFEFIENKLAILSDYEILGPPTPTRNSSKNIISSTEIQNVQNGYFASEVKVNNVNGRSNYSNGNTRRSNKNEDYNYKTNSIAESNASSKYEFFGFDPRKSFEFDNSYQREKNCQIQSSNDSLSNSIHKDKSDPNTSPITKSISRCKTSPSWTNPSIIVENLNNTNKETNKNISNGEYTTEQLIMQLDAIVGGSPTREKLTPSPGPSDRDSGLGAGGRDSGKFILPLPGPSSQEELHSLRLEKLQLETNLTSLKAQVADIRQKEEEFMTEEIEQALVGGELQIQNEKLIQEESRLNLLREKNGRM
uniref:FHA domain-containing protein n=1 Tax=Clastoptera arizonana TaxID=38151 RepID=A0A1B6EC11_9HEMI